MSRLKEMRLMQGIYRWQVLKDNPKIIKVKLVQMEEFGTKQRNYVTRTLSHYYGCDEKDLLEIKGE